MSIVSSATRIRNLSMIGVAMVFCLLFALNPLRYYVDLSSIPAANSLELVLQRFSNIYPYLSKWAFFTSHNGLLESSVFIEKGNTLERIDVRMKSKFIKPVWGVITLTRILSSAPFFKLIKSKDPSKVCNTYDLRKNTNYYVFTQFFLKSSEAFKKTKVAIESQKKLIGRFTRGGGEDIAIMELSESKWIVRFKCSG